MGNVITIDTLAVAGIITESVRGTSEKCLQAKRTDGKGLPLLHRWDDSLNEYDNHRLAAVALIDRLGWKGEWTPAKGQGGYLFARRISPWGSVFERELERRAHEEVGR